nr:AAA family ATPase [Deinobacterium chartae]
MTTPEQVALAPSLQVDAVEFQRQAAQGEVEAALALYAGPLLDGYTLPDAETFDAWLTAARERLADLRRQLLARRAADLEAQNDLRAALELHLALLAEDPLQEVHQREAIRLHTWLGERERALERYETFRRLLADELGLEPLPETVLEAERARQPQEGNAGPRSAPRWERLSLQPPLIGRGRTWMDLEAAGSVLAVLTGEPGVGKSRLAQAFAASFGTPLLVRCHEVSRDTPLYPVAEALRAALRDPAARARLEALAGTWRAEVARLVPEFPAPAEREPEGRARFVEGLGLALLAAAGPGGALLWDDLHWADASSVEVLAHVVRRAAHLEAPPRLLATARSDELAGHDSLNAALSGLRRDGRAMVLRLGGLSETEVCTLVQALSGGREPTLFARRLHAATGGNPLFVLETLRYLFETGNLSEDAQGWSSPFDERTVDYAELPIPPEVREVVLERVARLGNPAGRLLEAASLYGASAPLEDLAGATALSEWEALEAVERLTAASVLVEEGSGYRFTHDLLRRAVAEHLSAERRRLLHRRLAQALEARSGDAARIAEHLEAAGQAAQAVTWRVRCAEAATRVYAYPEALHHYQLALAGCTDAQRRFDLHLARADLLRILDDRAALESELEPLRAAAARLGGVQQAELDIRFSLLYDRAGRFAEARTAAEAALGRSGLTASLRAWALLCLGTAHQRLQDFAASERALRTLLTLPDAPPERTAMAHEFLAYCALHRAQAHAAREHNRSARELWQRLGHRQGQAISSNTAARLAMLDGDLDGARAYLHDALTQARALGDQGLQKAFLTNLVNVLTQSGQLEEALEVLQEGLERVQDQQDPSGEGNMQHRLGDVQLLRGRLGAALAAYQRACDLSDRLGQGSHRLNYRLSRARALLAVQRLEEAGALLEELEALAARETASNSPGLVGIERARHLWLSGRASEAAGRLQALLASETLDPLRREVASALLGQVRLALGDPAGAQAAVEGVGATPALRAAAVSVRIRAGLPQEAARSQAQELLRSGQLSPLETLELHRALAEALREVRPLEAAEQRAAAAALLERLSATLPPEWQSDFRARYAGADLSEAALSGPGEPA